MRAVVGDARNFVVDAWTAWNKFWFTPSDPATLSLLRLLVGAMLFYTHLVWSLDLEAFIGPDGWLPVEYKRELSGNQWSVWSIFFWIESTWLLWTVHILALIVFFCLMIGLFSRPMAVLAYLFAVSYAHRVDPGAFFGLDRINCMLVMYLMLGPCGARYSVDRILRLRRGNQENPSPSTSANIAIRLIQLHLCIIYLFSGLAKLEGENWLAGTAVWWAVANYEYQSLDATWLAGWPTLVALATHATVFWELFYCFLVWNRFTRPLMLGMALLIHGGIALYMGMITFGLIMIFANMAFISPTTIQAWVDPITRRLSKLFVSE